MKKIKYKGVKLHYKVTRGNTNIYVGKELKFRFDILGFKFGDIVEKPKLAFTLDFDIEDKFFSAKQVRKQIKLGFKSWNRQLDIINGNII